jgi:hypothetical protein
MNNRQNRILTNLGKDTYVRDNDKNIFKRDQISTVNQTLIGEIEATEPEPLFRQNMVTIKYAQGGKSTSVGYPGAFIDPISGNMHGLYEGPIPGQMVVVGFIDGNRHSPYVLNRYPYQGYGNTSVESKYINPLTTATFDPTDVILGHQSGSFMVFNTGSPLGINGLPGSVKIKTVSDFTVESTTKIVFSSVSPMELNGNSNFAVKYNELKTAFDQLKTDFNALVTKYNTDMATIAAGATAAIAASGLWLTPLTVGGGSSSTADMSTSKNTQVLM